MHEAVLKRLLPLAAPIPALLVGAMLMRHHKLGPMTWGVNLAVGAVALLIVGVLNARPRDVDGVRHPIPLALVALGMLAATFADAGSLGVHRWVHLGPISLYAAAVAVPMAIIAAGALMLRSEKHVAWSVLLIVLTAIILVVQPDAAQASALAAAMVVLVPGTPARRRMLYAGATLVIALAVWSWLRPDPLAPVPHVEGILGLARDAGLPWLAAAIVSLALLPLPFIQGGGGTDTATLRALGAWVVVCILVPLVRPYPVPLLGFGVSPIIGYAIALSAVRRMPSRPQ